MDVVRQHFKIIDSTNTWSKHNAHLFPHDKITLVTADAQTAGRGRFNRYWESPPLQNIYATFNFFVEKHRYDIGNIPQILALSTLETLETLNLHPLLKWPNDILLSNKKVAGILCETTPFSDTLCIILGIGLNINMPLEITQKIDRPATSLLIEKGSPQNIENTLSLLQHHFSKNLDQFLNEGFLPFLNTYKAKLIHHPSQPIQFNDNRTIWQGYFHSISNDGSLNLKLLSGEIRNFHTGEFLV
jgi:BirA family biotin operon repressor/biotin-[acetyl-CoA-carboxylase] ligase